MSSYARLCISIGALYNEIGMFDEAEEILKEGYRLSIALDEKYTEAKLLQNLANTASGLFEGNVDLTNAAVEIFRDLNDSTNLRKVYANLALIHARNKTTKKQSIFLKPLLMIFIA